MWAAYIFLNILVVIFLENGKEQVKINFNNIFHLIQHIQNIILMYKHHKKLMRYFTFFSLC